MLSKNNDTITSVSSGQGQSAIAVIRISGERALSILGKIFVANKPNSEPRTISLGWIIDTETRKKIDQSMVVAFKAPHSFTGEDTAEIYCHGGLLIIRSIIGQILKNGARLADKGEFSKRAFFNGKIDLVQAEAIAEAIQAKTSFGLDAAMNRIEGKLSKEISELKRSLEEILVAIEASVDFPDDIDEPNRKQTLNNLISMEKLCHELVRNSNAGKVLNDGIRVLIIGKPNVGKSSLLNAILKEERAIVTEVPGTTTDTIEALITIEGLPFLLIDTAGIREPKNIVETEGIKRAIKKAEAADMAIVVFDGSGEITEEDMKAAKTVGDIKHKIAVINKTDKGKTIKDKDIPGEFYRKVYSSALNGQGIKDIEAAIMEIARKKTASEPARGLLGNERQIGLAQSAKKYISSAIKSLEGEIPLDLIAIDVKQALSEISEISGENISAKVIDRIFGEFCIGK